MGEEIKINDEHNSDEINSILISIKKLLGSVKEYSHFDSDIIIHINSVFLTLSQVGVGPKDGFSINGSDELWDNFIEKGNLLNAVKQYVYLKVKLVFDPPTSASIIESINKSIDELEWRINYEVEKKNISIKDGDNYEAK